MKAKDLMIGDWVRKLEPGGHTIPVKVTGIIDEDSSVLYERKDGVHGVTNLKAFSPIPLTAEIIDMVGHHPKMALYWDDKKTEETAENWYELRICKDGDTALTMEIRYIHELQHALRLCGVEKEVVI